MADDGLVVGWTPAEVVVGLDEEICDNKELLCRGELLLVGTELVELNGRLDDAWLVLAVIAVLLKLVELSWRPDDPWPELVIIATLLELVPLEDGAKGALVVGPDNSVWPTAVVVAIIELPINGTVIDDADDG